MADIGKPEDRDEDVFLKPLLDAKTAGQIDYLKHESEKGVDELHGQTMAGVGGREFAPDPAAQATQNQGFGMHPIEAMQGALTRRHQKSFDSDMNALSRTMKSEAVDRKFRTEAQYNQLTNRRRAIELGIDAAAQQAELQYSAAKNQVLASILGAAGSLGGAMAGSMGGGGGAPPNPKQLPSWNIAPDGPAMQGGL